MYLPTQITISAIGRDLSSQLFHRVADESIRPKGRVQESTLESLSRKNSRFYRALTTISIFVFVRSEHKTFSFHLSRRSQTDAVHVTRYVTRPVRAEQTQLRAPLCSLDFCKTKRPTESECWLTESRIFIVNLYLALISFSDRWLIDNNSLEASWYDTES